MIKDLTEDEEYAIMEFYTQETVDPDILLDLRQQYIGPGATRMRPLLFES